MVRILICYSFKNMKLSDRNKFKRMMFGTKEKTHGGKYIAITKGILSNKQYQKPIRSVIIINQNIKNEVLEVLNKFNANYWVYNIID